MNWKTIVVVLCCALGLLLSGCRATVESDPALLKVADVKLEVDRDVIIIVIQPKSALPREQYIAYRCFKGSEPYANGANLVGDLIDRQKKDGRMVVETLCKASEVTNVKVQLSKMVPLE